MSILGTSYWHIIFSLVALDQVRKMCIRITLTVPHSGATRHVSHRGVVCLVLVQMTHVGCEKRDDVQLDS
jgi:hypothetical protein